MADELPKDTDRTKFYESGAFKAAVVASVVVFNLLWRPFVTVWGEAHLGAGQGPVLAAGLEFAEWCWLAAVGIQKTDTNALRWK